MTADNDSNVHRKAAERDLFAGLSPRLQRDYCDACAKYLSEKDEQGNFRHDTLSVKDWLESVTRRYEVTVRVSEVDSASPEFWAQFAEDWSPIFEFTSQRGLMLCVSTTK